jgi:hypothetical protein
LDRPRLLSRFLLTSLLCHWLVGRFGRRGLLGRSRLMDCGKGRFC